MSRLAGVIAMTGLLVLANAPSGGLGGAGSDNQAANAGQVVEVLTLGDAGAGSLRAALAGNAPVQVVFKVGGTIVLSKPLSLKHRRSVTIDGRAPGPGITLEGYGLRIFDSHDIVIRDLRIRRPRGDGIAIRGSQRIGVHNCSLTDATDENVSLTQGTSDSSVSWCIIGHTRHTKGAALSGMLVADFDRTGVDQISIHHNLFINNAQRSPQVSARGIVDIRNNVVWNWEAYGIRMRRGARGNVVNNVFRTLERPHAAVLLTEDAGEVYVAGNLGPNGVKVDDVSTTTSPFPAAFVTTHAAGEVESHVLRGAGARPRDEIDAQLVRGQPIARGEQ